MVLSFCESYYLAKIIYPLHVSVVTILG
jgi:hypothetical protein